MLLQAASSSASANRLQFSSLPLVGVLCSKYCLTNPIASLLVKSGLATLWVGTASNWCLSGLADVPHAVITRNIAGATNHARFMVLFRKGRFLHVKISLLDAKMKLLSTPSKLFVTPDFGTMPGAIRRRSEAKRRGARQCAPTLWAPGPGDPTSPASPTLF